MNATSFNFRGEIYPGVSERRAQTAIAGTIRRVYHRVDLQIPAQEAIALRVLEQLTRKSSGSSDVGFVAASSVLGGDLFSQKQGSGL